MKRVLLSAVLCILSVSLVGLAVGCAGMSPEARLLAATDTYTATVNLLAECRRAGLIDAEEAAHIEVWRAAAREALDEWRLAFDEGRVPESAVDTFAGAADALADALARAERRRSDGDQ